MAWLSRGIGAAIASFGVLVLVWAVAVTAEDGWTSDVEPLHLVLVALVGAATVYTGAWGAKTMALGPLLLGLGLAGLSFFGVIAIIGAT